LVFNRNCISLIGLKMQKKFDEDFVNALFEQVSILLQENVKLKEKIKLLEEDTKNLENVLLLYNPELENNELN